MSSDWRAIVIARNYAESGTLSGGSYRTGFEVTNLQDRDQDIVARTTDCDPASTQIVASLAQSEQVGGVIVCNGNWSLDSTYRVELSNTADFSVLTYDSGFVQFPGFVVDSTDLPFDNPDFWTGVLTDTINSDFPNNLVHVIPEDQRLNAFVNNIRVSFLDTTNAAAYLQYGYLLVGLGFQPQINYGENNSFGIDTLSDVSESLGGKRVFNERGIRRTWTAGFGFNETDEMFRELVRVGVKSRNSRPCFVIPDQTDELHLQNRAFLATFKQLPAIQQLLTPDLNSTALAFEEVL